VNASPPPVLLVEDNDDDAELTMMAFSDARIANPVVRARDGDEALRMLLESDPRPALVLLDLNLPGRNGIDILQAIRRDERTRMQPVVILTSSREDQDRFAAYTHHANSYVQKPVGYDRLLAATRDLGLYWLVLNVPPP
jgi:two-component system response regulator